LITWGMHEDHLTAISTRTIERSPLKETTKANILYLSISVNTPGL
jgi:hypothetical protein